MIEMDAWMVAALVVPVLLWGGFPREAVLAAMAPEGQLSIPSRRSPGELPGPLAKEGRTASSRPAGAWAMRTVGSEYRQKNARRWNGQELWPGPWGPGLSTTTDR